MTTVKDISFGKRSDFLLRNPVYCCQLKLKSSHTHANFSGGIHNETHILPKNTKEKNTKCLVSEVFFLKSLIK